MGGIVPRAVRLRSDALGAKDALRCSPRHRNGMKRTDHDTGAARSAPVRLAQHRKFLPAHGLQAQQVQIAGGHAASASGTTVAIDLGQPLTPTTRHVITLSAIDRKS